MGTAAYLSPEQVEGRPATLRSDLYAVGCLMVAALTGAPPYDGDSAVAVAMRHLRDPIPSVRARRPDVPVALDRVVAHSLEKDPARRYGSAAEMDAALRKIAPGTLPDTAPTVVMPAATEATTAVQGTEVITRQRERGRPGAPRTRRLLGALAALLFAAAAVWLLVAYMSNRPGTVDTPLPTESASATPAPTTTAPPLTPPPTPSPVSTTTQAPPIDLPGVRLGPPDTPAPDAATPTPTPSPTLGLPDSTPGSP
jgi:serine/threonine-protein kinase